MYMMHFYGIYKISGNLISTVIKLKNPQSSHHIDIKHVCARRISDNIINKEQLAEGKVM